MTKSRHLPHRHNPQAVFEWIKDYKQANDGNSPSLRNIGAGCAISSTNTVDNILVALQDTGQITLSRQLGPYRACAIQVVGGGWVYTRPRHIKPLRILANKRRGRAHNYQAIFRWIVAYKRAANGNSPTMREIGKAFSISSLSLIRHILLRLEDEGFIKWSNPNGNPGARAINVVGGRWQFRAPDLKQV